MQRISSQSTFFFKRIFPVIWFGFLAVLVIGALSSRTSGEDLPLPVFIVPVFMAITGYFVMKKLVFDLADEVSDAGDCLVVRFRNEEERIPLSDIANISYSYWSSPARVTLTLRTPCRFGKEVSFSPPQSFWPFAQSPIVSELIERVDEARRR